MSTPASPPVPRSEYPRPDFRRDTWLSLNGVWEFGFDEAGAGRFDRTIVVPFCYQSPASGVGDATPHDVVWYRRAFEVPTAFQGRRVLLQFGAVDYEAAVWVNGVLAGTHRGGNTPFGFDVTDLLRPGSNTLVVRAEDRYDAAQPRGKQTWKPETEACWYRETTGIWQPVWLEAAGETRLTSGRLTPDLAQMAVGLEVRLGGRLAGVDAEVEVVVTADGVTVAQARFRPQGVTGRCSLALKHGQFYDSVRLWSPESPFLYQVDLVLRVGAEVCDRVHTYFGMRSVEVQGDLILLNGSPYRQRLVLDQGYWTESLLTAPSDEALVRDIELAKALGFNGARKHEKVEDPRYYYHADRLGFLVWGELPSVYDFSSLALENLASELGAFIDRDYNHPCLITWVTLNESWGTPHIRTRRDQQQASLALYSLAKALDPTRLVSSNDGWEQTVTDLCAIHDYEASGQRFAEKTADLPAVLAGACAGRLVYAQGYAYRGEPILITEFGGIAFRDPDAKNWGYFGPVADEKEFVDRLRGILRAFGQRPWIRGFCYTQLTDVFQEVNGLLTMDRRPKVPLDVIRSLVADA